MSSATHPFACDMRLNFPEEVDARYVLQTLEVDEELQPMKIHRTLTVKGSKLLVHFEATEVRLLRAAVSSFYDMGMLTARTLLEFKEQCRIRIFVRKSLLQVTGFSPHSMLVDDLNAHEPYERHNEESFLCHRIMSLDDSRERLPNTLRSRNSMSRIPSCRCSSLLSSFGFLPGHEVIETSVHFLKVTRVAKHCEFKLLVDTGKEQFVLQKRFSQFRDLRQQLLLNSKIAVSADQKRRNGVCCNGACLQIAHQLASLKFPRRKMNFKLYRNDDLDTAKKRQADLRYFVDFLLVVYRKASKRQVRCCVNSQCGVLKAIQSFLYIDELSVGFSKATSERTMSDCEVPILDTSSFILSSPSYGAVVTNASDESNAHKNLRLEELSTIAEETEHHV